MKSGQSLITPNWTFWFLGSCAAVVLGQILIGLCAGPFFPGFLAAAFPLLCVVLLLLFSKDRSSEPISRWCGGGVLILGVTIGTFLIFPVTSSNQFLTMSLSVALSLLVYAIYSPSCQKFASLDSTQKPIVQPVSLSHLTNERLSHAPEGLDELDEFAGEEFDLESEEREESQTPGDVLQAWTRMKLPDDTEQLEGTFKILFRSGERLQHCHIPLTPPFSTVPHGWCESVDAGIRVEFSLLQTYGVRLTVRRSTTELPPFTTEISVVLVNSSVTREAA